MNTVAPSFQTILYRTQAAIATITLNRPERLNTIVPPMPDEIEAAVDSAVRDPAVRVIVLRGAGRSFCAGFDFGGGFHHWDSWIKSDGKWDPGKDFIFSTAPNVGPVPKFMSLWRSPKPVIAQLHGWCVGGGSDMALCADYIIASDDCVIGTPYSRMWGCYLTGMWIYRLGLTRVKELSLTGRALSGRRAAEIQLINESVPFRDLAARVGAFAHNLCSIPLSQLAAMKLVVNQAVENMGLASTQLLGPILDGLMRNTPDAARFIDLARSDMARALGERDGPWQDYSAGGDGERPDPAHVVDAHAPIPLPADRDKRSP
jgi:enoyl-CoA hydratase